MKRYLVLGVLVFGASHLIAGFKPTGPPFTGHSWGQAFVDAGVGAFDMIAAHMTSEGDYFESETFRNFSAAGWRTTYEEGGATPTLAVAAGPAQSLLLADMLFTGEPDNPLGFDFVTIASTLRDDDFTVLESLHAEWSGNDWTVTTGDWGPDPACWLPPAVPAPGAIVLGAIGLGLVGWVKRRLA